MAAPSTAHLIAVPEPLAQRLDAMVRSGDFATFSDAAVAMIQLGLAQHELRGAATTSGAGPVPPSPRAGPSGPPAGPKPPGGLARGARADGEG